MGVAEAKCTQRESEGRASSSSDVAAAQVPPLLVHEFKHIRLATRCREAYKQIRQVMGDSTAVYVIIPVLV
jgi:hypothetical protein